MRPTLPPDYRPSDDEEFMNPLQLEYFRQKLLRWRAELLAESSGTLQHLKEESLAEPDITDRASLETDRGIELQDARPRAQAHLQDRRGADAHRGRQLRLLRGNRRADRPAPARGPAHRHA